MRSYKDWTIYIVITRSGIFQILWNKWDENCSDQIQPRIIRIRVNEGNWFPLYCKIMYTFLCRVITTHAHKNQRWKVSEKRRKKSKRKAVVCCKIYYAWNRAPQREEIFAKIRNRYCGKQYTNWIIKQHLGVYCPT